jgi:molybdopterin molybdotransferase
MTTLPNVRMRGFRQRAEPAALTRLLEARLVPLGSEAVSLQQADRRVLAQDVVAPTRVRPVGWFDPQEDGQWQDAVDDPAPGDHWLQDDVILAGAVLSKAGQRIGPVDLALFAIAGVQHVHVVRRPTVELLVTGNELLPCGSRPEGYRIVDSNSVMLAALATRDGGCPRPAALVPDERDAIRSALCQSAADAVLISGGSSVGTEDFAAEVLAEVGELCLHGISMRPGGPTGLGFLGGRPVFLLPGNPVACLCAYDLFAGHAIRRLAGGAPDLPYPTRALPLWSDINSAWGRLDYVRVRLRCGQVEPVSPAKGSGASALSSTTIADGFILIPTDREGLRAGETVKVHLYGSINSTAEHGG